MICGVERIVLALAGPLLGFFAGWGLFELTEWRRRRRTQRSQRRAVQAELSYVEILLVLICFKYADAVSTATDIAHVAQAVKWYWQTGRLKARRAGHILGDVDESLAEEFGRLNDEQIVAKLATTPGMQETVASELHLPIVDAVLGAPTSGFSDKEVQALTTARTQAHLLNENSRWMNKYHDMSFTVADEGNHRRVLESHQHQRRAYLKRALVLLDFVRAAQATMRN